MGKLTAVTVSRKKKPGRYGDGDGLWLQVGPTGGKSWLLRYELHGRARQMGLGPVDLVPLADARDRARAARRQLLDGIDPIEARRQERAQRLLEAATAKTFKECAVAYIAAHEAGWKNEKHAAQWPSTMEAYVYPMIGALPAASIDTGLVLKCLEPIWTTKPETAGRVRGRIERVLAWAKTRGYRQGENPARWRGHLDTLLPARSKVQRVNHHAALPYAEIPGFMADLRQHGGTSARALEFVILTAARTGEAIGAKWPEIDTAKAVWTIPAERMKSGKEHRVPLSGRALEILDELPSEGDFVFPGGREGKPLSNMALLMQLRRMNRDDLTAHGFRSTFRDWAAEQTAFPNFVAEMALAHVVGDKVEAAYRRGDLMAKRAKLMQAWASYCATPASKGTVTPIRGRA